jgi:hypothetical protein
VHWKVWTQGALCSGTRLLCCSHPTHEPINPRLGAKPRPGLDPFLPKRPSRAVRTTSESGQRSSRLCRSGPAPWGPAFPAELPLVSVEGPPLVPLGAAEGAPAPPVPDAPPDVPPPAPPVPPAAPPARASRTTGAARRLGSERCERQETCQSYCDAKFPGHLSSPDRNVSADKASREQGACPRLGQ